MLVKLFVFALMVVGALALVMPSKHFLGPCPRGTLYSKQLKRCVFYDYEGEANMFDFLYN
ncbi:unnamed protein product [Spodoptera littoralis]|uniref:Uncharacterized protein n=1 Tax=Spodoptera littoralis TaxID=7109 RepID=A0A9P0I9A1_SPOLI|nr:unnamed protein product [Spodoptera littoralis]